VSDGARIKGAGIVHFLRWYVERFGHARLRRTAAEMPEQHRAHFDLLGAFAPLPLLEQSLRRAEELGYLGHEYGDAMLVLPGALSSAR
jgi:hypothetical protein